MRLSWNRVQGPERLLANMAEQATLPWRDDCRLDRTKSQVSNLKIICRSFMPGFRAIVSQSRLLDAD